MRKTIAYFHLPGLFEAYAFYRVFLPLFFEHREYFYDWCAIGSLYGAPADCIWGGGRVGSGDRDPREVLALTREYGISARLTFSNSLLRPEHLSDPRCNRLCRLLAESPGPQVDKLVPKVQSTAKILYGIYFALTVLEVVFLLLGGMPLFESLLTSFGTTGTGGFGFRNDSFASFSPAIQNTVTTFMILSGINYTFYFCILSRRIKDAFRIEEVRWYLFLIFASVGMITYNIRPLYANTRDALRNAFFQVGAIITTTGYSTADFDMWPALSQTILVTLMFVGACAGSTGGGMKVSRLVILFKTIRKELSLIIHPREIRKIRMDGHVVEHSTLRSTNVFLVIYFILLMLSTLIISLDEFDFTTNFTAVVSCLNNIGPGLNRVGPAQNFSIFSPLSKVVLIFDMLAGRLELFPLMILFMPSTWRKK